MTGASALLALALALPPRPDALTAPPFGEVRLVWPAGAPRSAVVLLEGDGAWEKRMRDLAAALASGGTLVLAVDTNRYLGRARAGRCVYAAGDLEVLSQSVQKTLALPAYLKPVLVGYSSGATLAYAALAQAPVGTFAGALSIGFCSDLPTPATLCKGESLVRSTQHGREALAPSAIRAPWKLYAGTRDRSCRIDAARTFAARVPGSVVVAIEGAGHDYAERTDPWMARASGDVVAMSLASQPRAAPLAEDSPISDLPLVEVPASSPGPLLAIVVTGDGGWASIDRALADRLTAAGIAVVGLDSLRYFWSRKTAGELGADLRRIAAHYGAAWHRDRLVLVGYSRGADAIPLALAHVGDDVLARLRLVALLGPGLDAELEIHVADLFTGGRRGEPLLPAVTAIASPILCVYGSDEEQSSVCSSIQGRPRAHVVALAGGHHFDGDYAAVARLILDDLR